MSEVNHLQGNPVSTRFIELKIIKASEGDLPTKKSAYITRSSVRSSVTGERFSWRHKRKDLFFTEIMLPEGVDQAFLDPEHLWSTMERADVRSTPRRSGPFKQTKAEHRALLERIDHPGPKRLTAEEMTPAWRDDAQLAYHVIIATPHEFSEELTKQFSKEFVQRELLPHRFICQIAGHRPDPKSSLNWHVHLLIAPRKVIGAKVGNKIRGALANFANRTGGSGYIIPDGDWPDRLVAHQEDFARRHGVTLKTSPKSAVPLPHIGAAVRIEGSDRAEVLAATKADAAAALEVPGLLPELLTEGQPTFTLADALALVMRKPSAPADPDSIARVLKDYPALVPLFEVESGQFSGRFTVDAVREQERDLAQSAADLRHSKVRPERQRALRQAAEDLAGELRDADITKALRIVSGSSRLSLLEPVSAGTTKLLLALYKSCQQAGYTCLDLAPNVGSAGIPGNNQRRRSLTHELHIQELLEAGKYDAYEGGPEKKPVSRQGKRPKFRKSDIPKRWDSSTCIILSAADQLDPGEYVRLFDRAARTGARVILIGASDPRPTIGRGGAYAIVRAAIAPAGSDLTVARLPDFPAGDPRQPSLAYAAAGDRRSGTNRTAAAPGRASAPPAPRPWRWPGASLTDIHNLSLASDCQEIERRIAELAPTEMLAVYRTLPAISDSGDKPNPHPLAKLHRQVRGNLRRVGIDGRFGRTDVDCLRPVQTVSPHSWRRRPDLAPRPGYVDVRPLLAPINATDMVDWRALVEHMKPYPAWVLRDIVGGLDDLFDRAGSDEVRYALSVAKLQIFVMAKDSDRDLVPETSRQDLWSIMSSAERIYPNVRFDDRDGSEPLILAATLPPPGYRRPEPIIVPRLPTAPSEEPAWLRRPAWSPLGEYGVDPQGGQRRKHFLALCDASHEQRTNYLDGLLRIYHATRDLAMRAWCAVGLQHCASWHRQTDTPMPIELEISDESAKLAVVDWRLERGYEGDPFEAARGQFWLERMASDFLEADTRDRQLDLTQRIAAAPRPPSDAPKRYKELLSALRAPANHLRARDGVPDPVIFGAMLNNLRRYLGKSENDLIVDRERRSDQIGPLPSPQAHDEELSL